MKKIVTLLGMLLFLATIVVGQITMKGTVSDVESKESLIGATIHLANGQGFATDENGNYEILITEQSFPIDFRYIGYRTFTLSEMPSENLQGAILAYDVSLKGGTSVLDVVVISGSRFEKNLEDEAATIEVVSPQFIQNNNITNLADIMERVPGVQMMDNQINIRSSGYQYGAGSRVGLVVDGQPILGGLQSDINWSFVPLENIDQIEVMKGASSVLYGAAAMNGVVNVRTAYPTDKPQTSISLYGSLSDSPKSTYRKWWATQDTIPFVAGAYFAHRQKFGKLDVVLGGNVHKEIEPIKDMIEDRVRFSWKTRYRLSDRVNFGINGIVMDNTISTFFIWQDADTNALRPISNTLPNDYRTINIDPHLTIYSKDFSMKHSVKGRFYNVVYERPTDTFDNPPSFMGNLEYQFQKTFKDNSLLTVGTSGQYFYAEDPRPDIDSTDNYLTESGYIAAVFGQWDKKLLNDKMNLVVGLRGEYFNIGNGDVTQVIPVTRLGATYKLNETNIVRANFGQGYRIPSLIERYLDIVIVDFDFDFLISSLNAIPNPTLRPEIGWSTEIGYKKLFKTNRLSGYFDVAFFNADYTDLAELVFDFHGEIAGEEFTLADVLRAPELLGFKMINLNRGRIAGFEVGTHLNGKIGDLPFRLWGGYTYTYAANLDSIRTKDMSYFSNFFKVFNGVDEELRTTFLPYTNSHTAKTDLELYFGNVVTLGLVANFNGYVHRIDGVFEEGNFWAGIVELINDGPLVPGFTEFRETSKGGDWVFDARLKFNLGQKNRLHFIVNNLFNREYAVRPGRMNPLRNFVMKYELRF